MPKVYLLISGLYILIFGLSDFLGEDQLRSFETWWLGKAKQSRDFILKYGNTTRKFILATIGSTILSIAIYSPCLISSFLLVYIPYKFDKFSHWIFGVLFVLLGIFWLFAFIFMMWYSDRPISYLGRKVSEIKLLLDSIENSIEKKTERQDIPLRGLPIETQFCIRLISLWDKFIRRGAIRLLLIGGLGAIPLLVIMIIQYENHANLKLILTIYFGYGMMVLSSSLIVTLIFCLLITSVFLFGFLIRVSFLLVIIPLWLFIMVPPLLLNRIGKKTGQQRYFKVGTYLFLVVNFVISLIFIK